MTDPSRLSFLQLHRFFDEAFWRGVVEHALTHRSAAPAHVRDSLEDLLRHLPVSGFRAASKAPLRLQVATLVGFLQRNGYCLRTILAVWAATQVALRTHARRILLETDFAFVDPLFLPRPLGTWDHGDLTTFTAALSAAASVDAPAAALILCAVTGLVPAASSADDEDLDADVSAVSPYAETAANDGRTRIDPDGSYGAEGTLAELLGRLRDLPTAAPEWQAVEAFLRDVAGLRADRTQAAAAARAALQADVARFAADAAETLRFFGATPEAWTVAATTDVTEVTAVLGGLRARLGEHQAALAAPRCATVDDQRRHRAKLEQLEQEIELDLARLAALLRAESPEPPDGARAPLPGPRAAPPPAATVAPDLLSGAEGNDHLAQVPTPERSVVPRLLLAETSATSDPVLPASAGPASASTPADEPAATTPAASPPFPLAPTPSWDGDAAILPIAVAPVDPPAPTEPATAPRAAAEQAASQLGTEALPDASAPPAGASPLHADLLPAVTGSDATSDAPEPSAVAPLVADAPVAELPRQPPAQESIRDTRWSLVWELAGQGRLGLAHHLAACAERGAAPPPAGAPSAGLLAIAALSPLIATPADDLRELLAVPLEELVTSLASPDRQHAPGDPVSILAFGALLRPTLLGPPGEAATALRKVPLQTLGPLEKLRDAVVDFTRLGLPLSPAVLRGVRAGEDWASLQKAFQSRGRVALASWRQSRIIYAPTTDVWRSWLDSDGPLGRHLEEMLGPTPPALARIEGVVRDWSDAAFVNRNVKSTDEEIRGRKADLRPIEARALKAMHSHVQDVLTLFHDWVALQERRPQASTGRRYDELDQCRQGVRSTLPAAERLLAELQRSGDPWVQAAAAVSGRAVRDLATLFDHASSLPASLPPVAALSLELLRIPGILLNEAHSPIVPGPEALEEALRTLASTPAVDWDAVFQAQCAARNHRATEQLVALAAAGALPGVGTTTWAQQHQDALAANVAALAGELQSAELAVTSAALYDLLPEQRIGALRAQIADIQPEHVRHFPSVKAAITEVRREIAAARAARVAEVRSRLAALGEAALHDARTRIEAALENGDFLTATEFVDMAERREPLPAATPTNSTFEQFFGGSFIPDLAAFVAQAQPAPRDVPFVRFVATEVGAGRTLGPVVTTHVPHERRASASALLTAWYTGKHRIAPFEKFLVTLLTHLGFAAVALEGASAAPQIVDRRWSVRVRTEPLADRGTCALPQFGSLARGQYRLLCIWEQPTVEEVVRWAEPDGSGAPLLVLYFGLLSSRQRRELAHLCRERHRTLLVLDEALVYFLCTVVGDRLAAFFRCAAPFTLVHPYVTGLGLVPVEMFYGRERERREVWELLGTNLVFGGRQLGKTALLRDVERRFHRPADGQIVRWIDLKNEMLGISRPIDELWAVLAHALRKEGIVPATASTADTIEKSLLAWLGEDARRRILLLLDEADLFLESDQALGQEQFKNVVRLKGIMEKTERRFKVVFAGLHNVQRTSRDVNSPLAHLGRPICIGPLLEDGEAASARELIEVPFGALGVGFDPPDLPMRVLSLTNYYPSLIQTLCKHLHARLSNPKLHLFDPSSTPPYVVTSRLLDDAQTREARDELVKLFQLTLDLDPRYRVIALLLAWKTAAEPEARYFERGFDVPRIREEVLAWGAVSFRDDRSVEAVRTTMDEMIGLGILRRTAGERYSLRSPNVVNLLGTKEELERELSDALVKQPPAPYEPASFRRTLRDSDSGVRSPLTAQQESLLLLETGVSVVVGTRMAGRDNLPEGLKAATDGADYDLCDAPPLATAAACISWLEEIGRDRRDRAVLAVIGAQPPWDGTWVDQVVQWTGKRAQRRKPFHVVFVGDAARAWLWVRDPARERRVKAGLSELTLRPWADGALRQWMSDTPVAPGDDALAKVVKITGGWPELAYAFARRCRSGAVHWQQHLEQLASELAAGTWLPHFEVPAAQAAILREAAQYEPLLEEDLDALTGDTAVVRATFTWADLLGLSQRVERGRYAIDPVLARMLAAAS